jgi:hypothetical protein
MMQFCKNRSHQKSHRESSNNEENSRRHDHDDKKLLISTLIVELRFLKIANNDHIQSNIKSIDIIVSCNR